MTTMEKYKILAKVDKNKYHVVYLVKDNKTEMEVHNISLF